MHKAPPAVATQLVVPTQLSDGPVSAALYSVIPVMMVMLRVSGWPDVSLVSAPREDKHQVRPQYPGLGPLLLPLCRGNVSYNLSWAYFTRWQLIIWSRCIPCALVPFCMTRFRVTEHYCSNCGILLGKYKGWKGKAAPWGLLFYFNTPAPDPDRTTQH